MVKLVLMPLTNKAVLIWEANTEEEEEPLFKACPTMTKVSALEGINLENWSTLKGTGDLMAMTPALSYSSTTLENNSLSTEP
ncbi:hypothetical protein WICPIJ_009806 [Wickerhamomyces pijperi]|uniref:Uncharacterized protein n=1 Tax=Wickerhamomyces pijperi TaxID=599730 RepID=A0A9P8PJQ7_WICPI|nr:hypothetical protein WICPIJ_009806 [Wickerhamomyces pijperi]